MLKERRVAAVDDEPDFGEFVRERSAALFRMAYALTSDRDAADDLVQEALERACRHWNKARTADSPEAYVRRILVNLANRRWRRIKRGQPVAEAGVPVDAYGLVEVRAQLIQALQTLPMGMRTAVVLRYFHDMSDAQIADMLGISPGGARSQVARGLAKLRAAIPPQATPPDAGDLGVSAPRHGVSR